LSEAVGCVDEAVEDVVGDGRVGDDVVPVIDRQLAGEDGAGAAVTVVDDLEDVAALLGRQGRQAPIVVAIVDPYDNAVVLVIDE
jgi:hypothetical protein